MLTLLTLLTAHGLEAQETLAIQARKIITGTETIENGTLLVKNGKIVAIGKDVKIPFDAKVERFSSGVLVPGFIESHSTAGLRTSNEYLPEVPYISVLDGIDVNSKVFTHLLRDGVTAVHVIPGNSTRIGGQGAVLRPVGDLVEAMVIKSPSAIKISLAPTSGESTITHMAALRRSFMSLYNYLDGLTPLEPGELISEGETGAAGLEELLVPKPDWKTLDFDQIDPEKIDPQKRPLVDLVQGKISSFIYCPRAADIFKAYELMDVHGIDATIVLPRDADEAAAELAARADLGIVILDPRLERSEIDRMSGKERRYQTARILHDAGIRFAVSARVSRGRRNSSAAFFSQEGSYHLWYQAAQLVRQGIPRDEALRSITLYPAQILGLDHRMGSLEPGKDANFSVFTGDPFDARSWVDQVYVEGRKVYSRDEDRDLQEILRRPEKGF